MHQRARYRVTWNEHKGGYDIQIIRLRNPFLTWLSMKPDSAEWFAWLGQIPSFHFQGQRGHFTARKETRARGGVYWIAYRHIGGQLIKNYIGTDGQVNIARLEEIAGKLETKASPEP